MISHWLVGYLGRHGCIITSAQHRKLAEIKSSVQRRGGRRWVWKLFGKVHFDTVPPIKIGFDGACPPTATVRPVIVEVDPEESFVASVFLDEVCGFSLLAGGVRHSGVPALRLLAMFSS